MDNLNYELYNYRTFLADLLNSVGLSVEANEVKNPQNNAGHYLKKLERIALSNSEIRERLQIECLMY